MRRSLGSIHSGVRKANPRVIEAQLTVCCRRAYCGDEFISFLARRRYILLWALELYKDLCETISPLVFRGRTTSA